MAHRGSVRLVVALLVVLAALSDARAALRFCTWQGASGGNWDVAANWSCGLVPNNTATDQFWVTLPIASTDVVLNVDATVNVYTHQGGKLRDGPGTGDLTVGTMEWSGGTIESRVVLQGLGTWDSSLLVLENAYLHLKGGKQSKAAVTLPSFSTLSRSGIAFERSDIERGSSLSLGDSDLRLLAGAKGTILNRGKLVKSTGGGTSTIDWNVLNVGGVIEVIHGRLLIADLRNEKGVVRLAYTGFFTPPILESPRDIVFTKSSKIEGVGTLRAPNVKNGGRIKGPARPDGLVLKVEADYVPPPPPPPGEEDQGSDTLALFDSSVGGPGWLQDYNSRVEVSGNAELSGLLTIEVWPGYTPPTIYTYPVLEVDGALTGDFDNVPHGGRLNTIDAAGSFLVQYGSGPYTQQVALSDYGPPLCGTGGPWGGVATGCLPSNPSAAACEDAVAKNAGKLVKQGIACHRKHAKGKFPTPAFEEDCEAKVRDRFDAKVGRLGGCPSCVVANADLVRDKLAEWLDGDNGLIFCEGTVPLGDDDTGFFPSDPIIRKCEDKIAVAAAKLATEIIDCRRDRASGALPNLSAEAACVGAAEAAFDQTAAMLEGCPACATANLAAVRDGVDAELARRNGMVFCGSPSGAFLYD